MGPSIVDVAAGEGTDMDPQSAPYRPSWLPFGPSRRSEMTDGTSGVRLRTMSRTRIPMAPVQLGRQAMTAAPAALIPVAFEAAPAAPAPTMQPRTSTAPTMQPRTSTLPPLGKPRRPRQTAARRPAPQAPPRYVAPQVAPSSATAQGYPAQAYPPPQMSAPGGAVQAYQPPGAPSQGYPPPRAPRARSRQRIDRSRVPLPAIAASASAAASAAGGAGAGARPSSVRTASFDPMAIVAIVLTFVLPPVALALALASLGRSYKTGVSPALSWLSVLVAGVGTLITFGILSTIVAAFQGMG